MDLEAVDAAVACGDTGSALRVLLAAWCELRHGFRHFRADRVVQLTDTGWRYPERRHALLARWRTQVSARMPVGQPPATTVRSDG